MNGISTCEPRRGRCRQDLRLNRACCTRSCNWGTLRSKSHRKRHLHGIWSLHFTRRARGTQRIEKQALQLCGMRTTIRSQRLPDVGPIAALGKQCVLTGAILNPDERRTSAEPGQRLCVTHVQSQRDSFCKNSLTIARAVSSKWLACTIKCGHCKQRRQKIKGASLKR